MATANITLDNAKFYTVVRFDVKKGQQFAIDILDDPGPLRWFADNDPVLTIKVDGMSAQVKADEAGESEIRIYGGSTSLVMTINVNVVEEVVLEASSLNPSAGEPQPKGSSTKINKDKPPHS